MKRIRVNNGILAAMLTLLLVMSSLGIWAGAVAGDTGSAGTPVVERNGRQIEEIIISGKPPETAVPPADVPSSDIDGGISVLSDVPAFDWSYGCSATSAAMMFGYYDRTVYGNMYSGATNGGVCPLDNSVWGDTVYPGVTCHECPLSATHEGVDGRTLRGHVDDYWIDYLDPGPDPYITNGWEEHVQGDCTADFMGTNQSVFGKKDGSTSFYYYPDGSPLYDYSGCEPGNRDGCHGLRLFAESRGYSVVTNFSQRIKGQGSDPDLGFTFADYVSEIDAGAPVLVHVTGHTMLGYGYDTSDNTVYIRNTWDHSGHEMTWGSTYSGMQHFGVTVIRLASPSPPAVTTGAATDITPDSATLNGTLDSMGSAPSDNVSFEWGLTLSYGNETTPQALGGLGDFSAGIDGLALGVSYHFRAKASDCCESAYGDDMTFTTALPVPALVYPADGRITTDNTPWLDWSDVSDPPGVTYRLQVDNDSDFSSPGVNKSGLTLSSRTVSPALADGTYYWRARAADGVGNVSDWTAAWTFTVDTTTPPVPSLEYHADGKVTKDSTPWLNWSDVADATGVTYQLQVDNNADFSSLVFSKTGMTSSSRTLGTLADDTYYWRVRAVDGAGNASAWTAAWSFTVDATTPSAPVLLYPADGKVTADTTPWLDWSDVADATGVTYRLQVDDNSDFSSPVVNKSGLTLSSRTLSTLGPGTYYWRARAVDGAGNASAWTAAWSFTIV